MGYRVVIATDNTDVFRRWTVPALGLDQLLDEVITPDERGCFKADADSDGSSLFFADYQTRFPHDRCVIIDDIADEATMQKFGIDLIKTDYGVSISPILRRLADGETA